MQIAVQTSVRNFLNSLEYLKKNMKSQLNFYGTQNKLQDSNAK